MKEKKEKKAVAKTLKIDTIISAYDILATRTNAETGKVGIKLSALDTKDMYKVLKAMYAAKTVFTAFSDFQKDINEKLKPENWDEIQEKRKEENFLKLSLEERAEIQDIVSDYNKKRFECINAELNKEKELEAYERLSEESFGTLVKNNTIDALDVMLLHEILV